MYFSFINLRVQYSTFLEVRRANNIAIGLSRFYRAGLSNEDIFQAVEKMETLTVDDLLALTGIQPTTSESALARTFSRKQLDFPLAPAEAFLVDALRYPDLSSQILAFLFSLQYPIDLGEIFGNLDRLCTVTKLLMTHPSFKALLRTILELGNMTNYEYSAHSTSYRPWMGNQAKAIGFKIDGLAQLADVKSADGKWNLMSFLVEMLYKQSPELLNLAEEFKDISVVAKYDPKTLALNIHSITATLHHLGSTNFDRQFKSRLYIHLDAARELLSSSKKKFEEFVAIWRDALVYFGEDAEEYNEPSLGQVRKDKKPPEHLYTSLNRFFKAYSTCVLELRQTKRDRTYVSRAAHSEEGECAIQVTHEPVGTELVVTFEEMKELARLNQQAEYEEASRMFKRATMIGSPARAISADSTEDLYGLEVDDYE
jgi:Formin Homology 2 Domain